MREILFRGKLENCDKWIYGDLLHKGVDYVTGIRDERTHEVRAVLPETIGQYTGLTDKNGKEIFEGDIVQHYHYGIGDIGYSTGEAMFTITADNVCITFDNVWGYELEVIGTIHDNPELLGGEE